MKTLKISKTTASLVEGQIIVKNGFYGILFSFPAACWPPNSEALHQRLWVERLTPWWDMEQPQGKPESQRLREACVQAINKLIATGEK